MSWEQQVSSDPTSQQTSNELKASLANLPRNLVLLFIGAAVVNSAFPKAEPWVTLIVIALVARGFFKFFGGMKSQVIRERLASGAATEGARLPDRSLQELLLLQAEQQLRGGSVSAEQLEARRRELAAAKRRTRLEAQEMRQRVLAKKAPTDSSLSSNMNSEPESGESSAAGEELSIVLSPRRRLRQPIKGRKRVQRQKRQGSVRPSNMDSKIF